MEKMTYVQALTNAINALSAMEGYAETVAKLDALKVATEKRNTTKSKAEVAKADADAELAEKVLEVLRSATEGVTVSELKDMDETFAELKVQRLSAIVRKLMQNGSVERYEFKRKAYFRAVERA